MLHLWHPLSLLLLSICPAVVAASLPFENTNIVRTAELGGALVHVTTTFSIKALESGSKVYTIALGADEKRKSSWLEAKIKGQQQPLNLTDLGFEPESKMNLFSVDLTNPLDKGATLILVLETVQTHATRPWPERATQKDQQALKFDTDLFIPSPYHTISQRTKIKAPNPRIISFTEPKNLNDVIEENSAVTKSGATVTYGPYHNIIPSSNQEFVTRKQQTVTVHYYHDFPVLQVTKLKRAAEISHWGANLNIQDEIHLHNAGPEMSGQFSRLEHQTQAFYKKAAPHVLTGLTLHLPAGIHDAYYYDLVGNVSTSRLRTVPSVPKNSPTNRYSVLDLKPRYPLLGGWNYSFTLGWDSPLADSAGWDAKHERYLVGIPVMTLIPGAVVDEAEVKIILPEGAIDVEVFPPFPATANSTSVLTTYLDTIGRPALAFEYQQLTDKHDGVIYVSYGVPLSAHLKKPIAVATAFLGLFTLALGCRRIDFRIHKQ